MPRRLRLLRFLASALGSLALLIGPPPAIGDEPSVIPHGQSRLPGEPLTLAQVKPPDVTFYAVLDDGSEITVPIPTATLQAAT